MYILNNQQTRILENETAKSGIPHFSLMEFAGNAVARLIKKRFGAEEKRITVVCGCGNNGGDGFVVARKLFDAGAEVNVLLAAGEPTTHDAKIMFERIKERNIRIIDFGDNAFEAALYEADVIVDAIFGIGFHGNARAPLSNVFELINRSRAVVVAVDVPSGVDSDNGQVSGECVKADHTVTFTTLKPAHVIFPAVDYCGEITTASIGVPEDIIQSLDTNIRAVDGEYVKSLIPNRKRNTNKGDFGKLLSVCGSVGMCGSAVMAAKAAVCSGAGLVRMALPKSLYPVASSQIVEPVMSVMDENELGTFSASCKNKLLKSISASDACLIGCGLGMNDDVVELVSAVIETSEKPLVIDADGINAIAKNVDVLRKAKAPIIMTPHPGEMGRLLDKTAEEVQMQRMGVASSFAVTYGVYLVLKGANTIIADPDGKIYVNMTGNPGMSKAGSGDVLAGLIASLLVQGLSPLDAAVSGVYVHGAAGDEAAKDFSQHCMTPLNIIEKFPVIFKAIER